MPTIKCNDIWSEYFCKTYISNTLILYVVNYSWFDMHVKLLPHADGHKIILIYFNMKYFSYFVTHKIFILFTMFLYSIFNIMKCIVWWMASRDGAWRDLRTATLGSATEWASDAPAPGRPGVHPTRCGQVAPGLLQGWLHPHPAWLPLTLRNLARPSGPLHLHGFWG